MLKYNGWYWFDEMNEEIKNDFHIDAMDSLIYAIIAKLEFSNNQRKDIKKMDFEEILKIYETRTKERIFQEEDEEIINILEKDEIYKMVSKLEKDIQKYEKFKDRKIFFFKNEFVTNETEKEIKEIKKIVENRLNQLNLTLEEVKAQLKAIPNDDECKYQNAIEILTIYEILDEKGKINA